MNVHLTQARHNEDFLKIVSEASPNNYFDWKITVCFYASLHYLRALEKHSKKRLAKAIKNFYTI